MLVAALAACASDPTPPSCQQAIGNFYGAGCFYYDTSSGSAVAITETDMLNRCTNAASAVPSNCLADFNAWLECNNGVKPPANNQTCGSCSTEYMALIECH